MVTFDITFTFSPNAVGGFIEYRRILPDAILTYTPWETDLSIGNFLGYFPFTTSPMTVTVGGNAPHYQPNTTYQFRLKQFCSDGTETYSEIEGDYYKIDCATLSLTTAIDDKTEINQGGQGITLTWKHLPESSVVSYGFLLAGSPDPINVPIVTYAIGTIPDSYVDYTGVTLSTFPINNTTLIPTGYQMQTGIVYQVEFNFSIRLSTGYLNTSCFVLNEFEFTCTSYIVETGDAWGLQWIDCEGTFHECYSLQPYDTGVNINRTIRICSWGTPIPYYCDVATGITAGAIIVGGNVQRGARVTQVGPTCLPGYSDYATGLEDSNGTPVDCCAFDDVDSACNCI